MAVTSFRSTDERTYSTKKVVSSGLQPLLLEIASCAGVDALEIKIVGSLQKTYIQDLLDYVLHNVVPYSGLQSVEGHRIHVHAPKWVKVSVLGNIRLVLKISNLPKSEYCTVL